MDYRRPVTRIGTEDHLLPRLLGTQALPSVINPWHRPENFCPARRSALPQPGKSHRRGSSQWQGERPIDRRARYSIVPALAQTLRSTKKSQARES